MRTMLSLELPVAHRIEQALGRWMSLLAFMLEKGTRQGALNVLHICLAAPAKGSARHRI